MFEAIYYFGRYVLVGAILGGGLATAICLDLPGKVTSKKPVKPELMIKVSIKGNITSTDTTYIYREN